LSQLQGPFCIILNLLFGVKPLKTEWTGLLFAAAGVALVLMDPLAVRIDNFVAPNSTYFKLIFNEKNHIKSGIFFLVFFSSVQMFILSSLSAIVFTGGKATFLSTDDTWGCLGFLDGGNFMDEFILQGFFSAFWGDFG
jgi:hypothetical protein